MNPQELGPLAVVPPPPLPDVLGEEEFQAAPHSGRVKVVNQLFDDYARWPEAQPEDQEPFYRKKNEVIVELGKDEYFKQVASLLPEELRYPQNVDALADSIHDYYRRTQGVTQPMSPADEEDWGRSRIPRLTPLSEDELVNIQSGTKRLNTPLLPTEAQRLSYQNAVGLESADPVERALSEANDMTGFKPPSLNEKGRDDEFERMAAPAFEMLKQMDDAKRMNDLTRPTKRGDEVGELYSFRRKPDVRGNLWEVALKDQQNGTKLVEIDMGDLDPNSPAGQHAINEKVAAAVSENADHYSADGAEFTGVIRTKNSPRQRVESLVGAPEKGWWDSFKRSVGRNLGPMATETAAVVPVVAGGFAAASEAIVETMAGDDGKLNPVSEWASAMAGELLKSAKLSRESSSPTREDKLNQGSWFMQPGGGFDPDASNIVDGVVALGSFFLTAGGSKAVGKLNAMGLSKVAKTGLLAGGKDWGQAAIMPIFAAQSAGGSYERLREAGLAQGLSEEEATKRALFVAPISGAIIGSAMAATGHVLMNNKATLDTVESWLLQRMAESPSKFRNVLGRGASSFIANIPGDVAASTAIMETGHVAEAFMHDLVTGDTRLQPIRDAIGGDFESLVNSEWATSLRDNIALGMAGPVIAGTRSAWKGKLPREEAAQAQFFQLPKYRSYKEGDKAVVYLPDGRGRRATFNDQQGANELLGIMSAYDAIAERYTRQESDGRTLFTDDAPVEVRQRFQELSQTIEDVFNRETRNRAMLLSREVEGSVGGYDSITEAANAANELAAVTLGKEPVRVQRDKWVEAKRKELVESSQDWAKLRQQEFDAHMRGERVDDAALAELDGKRDALLTEIESARNSGADDSPLLASYRSLVAERDRLMASVKKPTQDQAGKAADDFVARMKSRAEAALEGDAQRLANARFGGDPVTESGEMVSPDRASADLVNRLMSIERRVQVDPQTGVEKYVYHLMFKERKPLNPELGTVGMKPMTAKEVALAEADATKQKREAALAEAEQANALPPNQQRTSPPVPQDFPGGQFGMVDYPQRKATPTKGNKAAELAAGEALLGTSVFEQMAGRIHQPYNNPRQVIEQAVADKGNRPAKAKKTVDSVPDAKVIEKAKASSKKKPKNEPAKSKAAAKPDSGGPANAKKPSAEVPAETRPEPTRSEPDPAIAEEVAAQREWAASVARDVSPNPRAVARNLRGLSKGQLSGLAKAIGAKSDNPADIAVRLLEEAMPGKAVKMRSDTPSTYRDPNASAKLEAEADAMLAAKEAAEKDPAGEAALDRAILEAEAMPDDAFTDPGDGVGRGETPSGEPAFRINKAKIKKRQQQGGFVLGGGGEADSAVELGYFDKEMSMARELISSLWDGSLGKLEGTHEGGFSKGGVDYRVIDLSWDGEKFEVGLPNKATHRVWFSASDEGGTNIDRAVRLTPKVGGKSRTPKGSTIIFSEIADMAVKAIKAGADFAKFASDAAARWGEDFSKVFGEVWRDVANGFAELVGADINRSAPDIEGAVQRQGGFENDAIAMDNALRGLPQEFRNEVMRRSGVSDFQAELLQRVTNRDIEDRRNGNLSDESILARRRDVHKLTGRKTAWEDKVSPVWKTLADIYPEVGFGVKAMEFRHLSGVNDSMLRLKPVFDTLRKFNHDMSILWNSDVGNVQRREALFNQHPELRQVWKIWETERDMIYEMAVNAGIKLGKIEEYFPREVKDYDAYLSEIGAEATGPFSRAWDQRSAVSREERIDVTAQVLGRAPKKLRKPGFTKGRKVESIDDVAHLYLRPHDVLVNYIDRMWKEIAIQEYLGTDYLTKSKSGMPGTPNQYDRNSRVGAAIHDGIENGSIDRIGEQKINQLISELVGSRPQGEAARFLMGGNMILGLSSPLGNIKQLGQLPISIFDNGLIPFMQALDPRGQKVAYEQLSANSIWEIHAKDSAMKRANEFVLNYAGLKFFDSKEGGIRATSTLNRWKRMSDTALAEEFEPYARYLKDAAPVESVIKSIREGNTSDPNLNYLLFMDLSGVRPTGLSSMPPAWHRGSTFNRAFVYGLRTFAVHQLDLMKRRIWDNFRSGNYAEAAKQTIGMAVPLMAFGAELGLIVKLLSGQAASYSDELLDTIIGQSVYLSRHTIRELGKGNFLAAVDSTPLFDFGFQSFKTANDMWKAHQDHQDALAVLADSRVPNMLPFGLKNIWGWIENEANTEKRMNAIIDNGLSGEASSIISQYARLGDLGKDRRKQTGVDELHEQQANFNKAWLNARKIVEQHVKKREHLQAAEVVQWMNNQAKGGPETWAAAAKEISAEVRELTKQGFFK